MKVLHPAIEHKTEAGGVHLGITDDESLGRALEAIDRIEGARYLIEEMAPSGPELILGARRDPAFGPIVALGSGGTAVEAADDASVRHRARRRRPTPPRCSMSSPAQPPTAEPAARRPSTRPSSPPRSSRFGDLIAGREDIAEIEVNPLRVTRDGLVALDALVVAR